MLMARDTARDEAQKLHRKWLKHQAFMAELARNKEWLAKIEQEGQELIQEKPELRPVVQQKLEEIRECWSDLETTTKAKARQLFENNKPEPTLKSYSDLDSQLSNLEQQPPQLEQAHHLPTFNEQLQKFQAMESQIGDFYKDMGELGSLQSLSLPHQGLMASEKEGAEQSGEVETRIVRLIEPLKERRRILLASKEMHQVAQDLEDEILWIQARLPLASGKDYGNSLQSVQQHVKKHQTLQRELTGRRARIEEVLDRAAIIASLRTPEVDFVREGAGHVRQLWEVLQLETERRSVMLDAALQSQQYYSEAAKVESWLSGQKLHVANEEQGSDEASTLQLLKAHLALEQTVETYAETVGMLSQQCQHLLELGHPESEQITKQQSHIDRLYVSLKDMVEHRKTRLEQQYWLYQLNKEVEELEKWITEREAVASSTELGNDLEEVTVLQERFTKFSTETKSIGEQRMEQVNKMVNEMIDCGHSDAATIAEWKDGLNESWADLLELMETRRQMLAASQQLHKFFTDCKEVLAQIIGKMKQLPEVRACQANITNPATLQRLMHSFEHALQLLVAQVRQLQENAAQLRAIYAGEKAETIMVKEQEIMEAWKELLSSCEASRIQVTSVTDKVQFFSVVRENLMWMEGIMGQIKWDEPRDLTALEGMMKHHQDLKAKIDGRSKTILQCADLGKILIAAGNPASEEIQEKLDSLLTKQKDLVEKWDKHQERLLHKQENFQFAQETVKAEAWLKAKEPLISSKQQEGGEAQAQTDEVEQLILRHEAFRKAAVTWKERFSSLRQLSAAEKKREEEKKTTPLSSRRMFPLSCLTPSVPSTSATSSYLRQTIQAQIEPQPFQTSLDLGSSSTTQRLSSAFASYSTAINGSGYHGLEQPCVGKVGSTLYFGMNQQAAGAGSDSGLSASQSGGADTSTYHGVNHQTAGSAESSGYFGVTTGCLGGLQNHLKPGGAKLESSGNIAQQPSSGGMMSPSFLPQQNMGSSGYLPQPQNLGSSGYLGQQSNMGSSGYLAQQHITGSSGYLAQQPNLGSSGYLAQNYQSSAGLGSSGFLAQNHYSSGSLGSSSFLAQSGGIMDPKMAYAWQHLKADFMQPRINHIHKAINPLLEASRLQREQFGDIPMADMVGPESGLELLHGRLQRDPRGSRSDPQMDHLRREREYKLGRQTSSEQEIQARLNELPLIVRQERYRRRMERQSSSEQEGSNKQRLQRQDSSDLEGSVKDGSDKRSGEKRSTMAEIVEQAQDREAAHARGEPYRPPSSLSAPVTRFDGRPRARDRPKPRRRPRPKEPETTRRSRSAPATGAPTTPQPPSHTAQNEGFLYCKKATSSDLEAQQRSPNSKSWVNVYCVLKEGKLTFYKDARNHTTTYNGEPPVDLSECSFDPSMGYKKKKNVFILQVKDGTNFVFHAKDEEDLKAWTSNITTSIAEHEAMAKWDKPGPSSMDPDRSERKEKSEGDADARSERSELMEGEERSEKERSEKAEGSEKLDTSEIADKLEGGAGGSSTSGRSK
ncbi:PREDICTED: spectrin beta chain, non-erythrocytic 4-like [Cyprinodon variegatus]|uniref:Spectrin beta chain, non-erythrocytic 4-like n=1 Tax=Cyprinodon variegatus TaxID=28743 RepID=A0A3Q2G1Y1_CYPVA|nr:PREDICTED: spectrin beta chain, non-erythrocytic 4-like [Cyprinodon variegatus]XP_015240748.1 PREDICTED: spectrin beta chain, non-erythrocytic 4-like [Cyprinodon variegatus]